jgi:UPF0716 protein FxsA
MNPGFIFLLIFVGAPAVELYFMVQVGAEIGAFSTVALVLFTAALGGVLVRLQGFTTAMRVRASMERGEVPAIEMMEGVLLLLAGLSLLLPGFVTDAIGFICLIPAVRRGVVLWFLKRSNAIWPASSTAQPHSPSDPRIIDAEYRREDDD